MALSSQAALLDALFGVDRNSTVKIEISWEDDSICKYFLAGFCPHELFVNTKMSLGQCTKLHDEKLLVKYKNSKQVLRMGYEKRLFQFLQRYVDDVKQKIVYNLERMQNGLLSGTEVSIQKRITATEKEINELVSQIEDFGNEGRIEECRNLNNILEDKQKILKYDRIELENQRKNTRERLEEVCNTCGAYISKNDPRNSLENHVNGRIHCSYVKLNEVLDDLNVTLKHCDESRNSSEMDRRSESRHRQREHEKKHDCSHRSRDRSIERKHRSSRHRSDRSRSNGKGSDRKIPRNDKKEPKSDVNEEKEWGEL